MLGGDNSQLRNILKTTQHMRYLEGWGDINMRITDAPVEVSLPASQLLTLQDAHSDESASLIDAPYSANESPNAPSLQDDFDHLSFTSSRTTDKKARLVYCKSHVAIHPTTFNKDNLSGYLGLVEVDAGNVPRVDTDNDGNVKSSHKKELLVTWVPNELLERMDEADREGYKRVATGFSHGPPKEQEEDGM